MRTLFEIIESAKDGEKPSYDECYYGMLAFSALHHFDHHVLLNLPEKLDGFFDAKWYSSESFRRIKGALNKSPKDYIGWSNDPGNPDYQSQRKIFKNIANKFLDTRDNDE